MKTISTSIKYLFLTGLLLTSACKKKDDLITQDNYLGQEVSGSTELDRQLTEIFVKPYNIDIRYKWDQSAFDMQYTLVPPREDRVLPAMITMKKVWIDPYNAETGSQLFMKTYAPKEIILAGSPILTKDGNGINGLGEGGLDILLSSINTINTKNKTDVINLLHLIHHEFTHILNQKKAYPPEFLQVSPASDYIADWYNSPVEPLSLGFISGYARKDPGEDFAEMVSWMLTWGKDYYENVYLKPALVQVPDPTLYPAGSYGRLGPGQYYRLADLADINKAFNGTIASIQAFFIKELITPNYSAGIAKLRQKEAIVVAYFKSAYNIDFYSLQNNVQIALKNATI